MVRGLLIVLLRGLKTLPRQASEVARDQVIIAGFVGEVGEIKQ